RIGVDDERAQLGAWRRLAGLAAAVELGGDLRRALLLEVVHAGRRGRQLPVARRGRAADRLLRRQLLVALDVARGFLREPALGAALVVVVAVRPDHGEVGSGAIGLGAGEEQLAGLPAREGDADRARQRDVERDPELDVLAARRGELAGGSDGV